MRKELNRCEMALMTSDHSAYLMIINYTNRACTVLTRRGQVESLPDKVVLMLEREELERMMMNG